MGISTSGYEKEYSDSSFWNKIGEFAKKAGLNVIYAGVLLNEVLKKPEISTKEKAVIIAALGYFISPLDLVPDAAPVIGFGDDLIALGMALTQVKNHITDVEKTKAKEQLHKWFKDFKDSELEKVDEYL